MRNYWTIVAGAALLGYFIYVYNQNQEFRLKQQCHDEAVVYVDNLRKTSENRVKLDASQNSYAYFNNTYSKELNTCIVYYGNSYIPDSVKFPNLGDSYYERIDDALTGKSIAWWSKEYSTTTYTELFEMGLINGKDTKNRQDFDKELITLFGESYNPLPSAVPTPIH